MKLYLVQHGEAQSKDIDPERPLTQKGHEDIKKIAQFLQQADVQVEQIIHSGKLRAEQTANYFSETIGGNNVLQINETIKPNDAPEILAQQISLWQQDTLIVGHLPYMAKLVSYLICGQEQPVVTAFSPGSVVCLEPDDDKQWQIQWMLKAGLFV